MSGENSENLESSSPDPSKSKLQEIQEAEGFLAKTLAANTKEVQRMAARTGLGIWFLPLFALGLIAGAALGTALVVAVPGLTTALTFGFSGFSISFLVPATVILAALTLGIGLALGIGMGIKKGLEHRAERQRMASEAFDIPMVTPIHSRKSSVSSAELGEQFALLAEDKYKGWQHHTVKGLEDFYSNGQEAAGEKLAHTWEEVLAKDPSLPQEPPSSPSVISDDDSKNQFSL